MVAAGAAVFGAAASEHPDAAQAVGEAVGAVLEMVGPGPDIAVLFVTAPHTAVLADLAAATRAILQPGAFVGAIAGSVIGGTTEMEAVPAVSIWAGHTGPAEPVRLAVVGSGESAAVVGLPEVGGLEGCTLLLFADPFSFPTELFVRASNERHPDLTIVGGLASGGGPGTPRLALQADIHHDGAVGLLLPAGVDSRAVVSQGARPLGEPFIVTAATDDVVLELGSRPALERLRAVLDTAADDAERERISQGLEVGFVVDESPAQFGPGDFLVRAVTATDDPPGSVRVGDPVPVGTTVQFHLRDAATAEQDLADLLGAVEADAALVFTGDGRGIRLFGRPDHDASTVSRSVRGGAVAGMSCAGEIGPVGGVNHVHGLTASVLLFRGPSTSEPT